MPDEIMLNQPQCTVLIVEDCQEDRECYRRYLLQDQDVHYTILEAQERQEGLTLWQRYHPDVVLLDYRLPDLNGLEWLAQLSPQPQASCLPVIVVIGQGNEAIAIQALKMGAQDYLVKGQITPERLQRTVQDTLERMRLRRQLHQRLERQQLVAKLTQQIHRSLDLNDILQTTATLVRQFLQTDRVLIFCLQSAGWGTVTTESVGADWTPLSSNRFHDPCFHEHYLESFRQGGFTAKSDIHDGSIDPCHVELLAGLQVRANLVVPILQDHHLWGLLIAHHCAAPRQWHDIDIDFLQEVATQMGIAVQQADLHQQAQQELAQRAQLEDTLRQNATELVQLTQDLQQHLEELQISEAQYRLLFESIDEGFCIVEMLFDEQENPVDFRFLQINPAFERLSTIQNAVGRRMREIAPQHEDYWFENFGKVALTGEPMRFENYAAELHRWYEVFAFPIAPARSHQVGILFTETSDRKRAEAALRENERRLSALMNNLPGYVYRVANNPDYTAEFISEGVFAITGYRQEEYLIDRTISCGKLIHPGDVDWIWNLVQQAVADQQPYECEYRLITRSGAQKWVWERGRGIYAADGELLFLEGFVTDISDRKQSELQLRDMSDAMSNAVEGISRLDPQGRYITVNEAYARAVGYTPAEMIGMDWQRTVHPDDLEAVIAEYQQMLKTGKVELEARGIRKDGSVFNKQLFMVSLYDDQHRFVGHHCFMKDITEKKQLEAQFLRVQRLESVGTLASGIAHDLNNVFTPILAAAQLLPLKYPNADTRTQQLLQMLENSAHRGADLVRQILSFGRGTEGRKLPLQIGHLLLEVVRVAQQTFPKEIEIQSHISTRELWTVIADTTQLHQVLMNLCVNARDAMPTGGILNILAENYVIDATYAQMNIEAQIGSYVVITISDTGTGIPSNLLDRIFDPFFTTKEPGKGTGLGLSTVIGIVKNHGGWVSVYSEVGKGTAFKVYLPASTELSTHSIKTLELRLGQEELILVVDDDAIVQQSTKNALEDHSYRTLTANDGIEAISLYAKHADEIDLVLMDMMMPNMDGLTAIRTLKKLNPEVQIIATSGLVSHRQNLEAPETKVQHFLPKPYTVQELLTVLYQVLHGE